MDSLTNQLQSLSASVNELRSFVQSPWQMVAYIFAVLVSGAGVWFSALAFKEARRARRAAINAGKVVKIQTVAIDLREISQRLDKLEEDIDYYTARDMINEVTGRLRRLLTPLETETKLAEPIKKLKEALDAALQSLTSVRPSVTAGAPAAPFATYNAIEANLITINSLVSDITGLCEQYSMPRGDADGRS